MSELTVNDPAEELRAWLTETVARYTGRVADRIDPHVALTEYGLTSVYALTICGDIEERLGVMVEPTIAWDYNTIDALVGYLTGLDVPDRSR
jgi:acyl carrier protein